MTKPPVSQDIAAALASYWHGRSGPGPSHSKLTSVFLAAKLADVAPEAPIGEQGLNKEQRVQRTVMAAVRRPASARVLIDGLLSSLRTNGQFDSEGYGYDASKFRALAQAFARQGWSLTASGELMPADGIDFETGGRAALDEQLARLRQNTDDPGSLLGTSKDVLEAVAKFVLKEIGVPNHDRMSYDELWHHARDRLGILPEQIAHSVPGAASIKAIMQSSWTIVKQVNILRNLQGAGHGRTLPTGVSPEQALLVVREACSMAEFTLATLDRQRGRR